jgi:Helix-turn-helix domain
MLTFSGAIIESKLLEKMCKNKWLEAVLETRIGRYGLRPESRNKGRSIRIGCPLRNWWFAASFHVEPRLYRIENRRMQQYQSYKFELRPNGEQRRQMRRIAGCCRFVFNQALAVQIERGVRGEAELDFAELTLRLAESRWRPETKWLARVPFGCLQQSLRNLRRAQAGYRSSQTSAPVFKKRGLSESFRYSGGCDIRLDQANSRLLLPQLG